MNICRVSERPGSHIALLGMCLLCFGNALQYVIGVFCVAFWDFPLSVWGGTLLHKISAILSVSLVSFCFGAVLINHVFLVRARNGSALPFQNLLQYF